MSNKRSFAITHTSVSLTIQLPESRLNVSLIAETSSYTPYSGFIHLRNFRRYRRKLDRYVSVYFNRAVYNPTSVHLNAVASDTAALHGLLSEVK